MKTITFCYMDAGDIEKGFHKALFDLAPIKGELSDSFVVPLSYLQSWVEDMKTDMDND